MKGVQSLLRVARPAQRKATYAGIAAAITITAVIHEIAQGEVIFPVDDAYISLHNAVVLASGHDANYHVPALVGSTSPAHVLLTSLLVRVMPAVWALETVAWLGALGYALALAFGAFRVGGSVALAVGLACVGLLAGQTPHHLLNGLETGLALAGTTFAIAIATRDERRSKLGRYGLPLVCGALPFIRPELVALSGLLLANRWYGARRLGVAELPKLMALDLGLAAIAAAPFLFACWHTTGAIWPNTVSAKKFFFAEGCGPAGEKLRHVFTSVTDLAATLGILSLGVIALIRTRLGLVGLIFGAVFLIAYFKEFPGALNHYEQRYMYVLVPPLLLGIAQAASSSRARWRTVGAFLLGAGFLESAEHLPERWRFHLATRRFTAVELAGAAAFVETHTSPSDVVLIHDAGYISYATTRRLVDIVGLKTPDNIHYHRDLTWATCGRERGTAIADIARDAHATVLVALTGWDDAFRISDSLSVRGWRVDAVRPTPAAYNVFRLTSP